MPIDSLTDAQIAELIACRKQVDKPNARQRQEGKHFRRDFLAKSADGQHEFVIFTRQSSLIPDSFTAGLRWRSKTGEEVILIRCNGPDHPHSNPLEDQRFSGKCHVHRATERYTAAGRKAETFAEVESSYRTLNGALYRLTTIANIAGLDVQPDDPGLFDGLS